MTLRSRFRLIVSMMVLSAAPAMAQNSSLLHDAPPEVIPPGVAQPMPVVPGSSAMRADPWTNLQGVSWTYQQAPPLRTFAIHDIVTIRVDEIARMMAEGEAEKRRISLFQATLADWIRISQGKLVPDPQTDGSPAVNGQSRADSRAESTVESRESMSFNIAAEVVDIRPNGNLVLEARKSFRVNDNLWETALSGTCRASDIAPDNVVLSRDLIHLEIKKEDQGQLREGYQRGWFQRFFDRFKPF